MSSCVRDKAWIGRPVISFSLRDRRRRMRGGHFMTAPRSLRELFDQIGLREVESNGTWIMETPVDKRVVNSAIRQD